MVGSIIGIAVVAIITLWINQLQSLNNQQIIDTMTMEYSVIALSDELAQSYNATVKNSGNAEFYAKNQAIRTKLLDTLTQLNSRIKQPVSRALLTGIDHTVHQVIQQNDAGLADMKQNNFTNLSDYYAQANKYNEFISENTKTLLGNELNYLYSTQQQSKRTYIVTVLTTFSLFILIVFSMMLVARSYANQLITPLTQLSFFAKEVANKNLQAARNKALQVSDDEIGSVTQSIYTMVDSLVTTLDREQQAAEEIKKTNSIIEKNNAELQQMNNLMIGRELKMAELKKELEDLKQKMPGA
jgi:nitrogen fixation/metabolism regulation signal transduction histidine kinase